MSQSACTSTFLLFRVRACLPSRHVHIMPEAQEGHVHIMLEAQHPVMQFLQLPYSCLCSLCLYSLNGRLCSLEVPE